MPKVCEYQTLAPFCLSKKPQMIVPILPKEKKPEEAAEEQQDNDNNQEEKPAASPPENIKIVFASIYIS